MSKTGFFKTILTKSKAGFEKMTYRLGKANDSEIATGTIAAFKIIFLPIGTLSDNKASKEQKTYAVTRDILTETIALSCYLGITYNIKKYCTGPICAAYYKAKGLKNTLGENFKINAKFLRKAVMEEDALRDTPEALAKLKKTDAYKHFQEISAAVKKKNLENGINIEQVKIVPDKFKDFIKSIFKGLKVDGKDVILKPDDLYFKTKQALSHVVVLTLALLVIPSLCNILLKPVMAAYKNKQNEKGMGINPETKIDPYPSHNVPKVFNNIVQRNTSFGYNNKDRISSSMKIGGV